MEFIFEIVKTVLLGIVEGITEWLPISSTGHMILLNDVLQLRVSDEFFEMFEVVIQLGAILAVVVLYFAKLWPLAAKRSIRDGNCLLTLGAVGVKKDTMVLWGKVLLAMLPAALIGIPIHKIAKADVAFHDIIFKAAGNPRLTQMVNNLAEQMYRYRFEYIKDDTQHSTLCEEHRMIYESISKHDVNAAKEAIRTHIENQEKSIIKQIRLEKEK